MGEIKNKQCSSCLQIKDISNFYKRKSSKDGYQGQCKDCMKEKMSINKKKYRESENGKKKEKEYKQSDKYKKYDKEYKQRDYVKEKDRERVKKYSQSDNGNKKIKEYQNSNRYKELVKKSYENRKLDGRRQESLKKYREKIKKDPQWVIDHRMSTAIRIALIDGKNGRSWEELVGYTREDLKLHLESLFTDGMTWEKFLNSEIHIDHIIPKSYFIYSSYEDEEFKKCWALSNLQPLWAKDNLAKSNKILLQKGGK